MERPTTLQVRALNSEMTGAATDAITITPAAADAGSGYAGVCEPIVHTQDPNVTMTLGAGATLDSSDADGSYRWTGTLEFSFSDDLDVVLAPHSSAGDSNFLDGADYSTDGTAWVQTLGASSITYSFSGDGTGILGANSDADAANADWGHFLSTGTTTLTLQSSGTDALRLCRLPEVPEAVTQFTVTPDDAGQLTLAWTAPLDDGGPAISDYKYSLTGVGGPYIAVGGDDTTTSHVVAVANGSSHDVAVLAVNSVGDGAPSTPLAVPSATLTATVGDFASSGFQVRIDFSGAVNDFALDDITPLNATLDNLLPADDVAAGLGYTFDVTPQAEGDVTLNMLANLVTNADGVGNTPAIEFSRIYDMAGPVFSVDDQGDLIFSIQENITQVGTVEAVDASGSDVTYAISGGDDAAHFILDSDTGGLSFSIGDAGDAPDYENPADADQDGLYVVTVSATDTADPDANSTTQIVSVDVTNELETPAITVLPASPMELDEGTTGEVSVSLAEEPTGDVKVTVSAVSGADSLAKVSLGDDAPGTSLELTFGINNWDTEQTVKISTEADTNIVDVSEIIGIAAADGGYDGITSDLTVTILDTTAIELVLDPVGDLTLNEGDSGSFTVALTGQPTADVTVTVASSDSDVAAIDWGGDAESLTFTPDNWDQAQTLTVVTDIDAILADGSATLTLSADGGGFESVAATKDVTVVNQTVATMTVSKTELEVGEAGTGSFTVVLDALPTNTVTLDIASGNIDAATVSASSLEFTVDNWDAPQTVTLTGVDDNNPTNETFDVTVTPQASDNGGYETVAAAVVAITMADDDIPSFAISDLSNPNADDADKLEVSEDGSQTFTVVLNTQPTADVTVTVAPQDTGIAAVSDGAGLAGADSFDLVFTTANWNVAQNVKVWGVSNVSVGDLETVINLTGSGSDADYAAVTGELGVVVSNTTVADMTLDPVGTLTLNEGDSGSFTVALTAQPTADVTVTVASSDSDVAAIDWGGDAASLTFTPDNWDQAQILNVAAVVNAILADGSATLTLSADGGGFESVAATKDVTVVNQTVATMTVSETELEIDEAGTGSFTVVLDALPTNTVTLDMASGNIDAATVSPSSLTFTVDNWDTPQTVTVTGVADDNATNETFDVTVTPQVSNNGGYESVALGTVAITMADDDTPGLTISDLSNSNADDADKLEVSEDGSQTFTVQLDTEPTADVTVTVAPQDTGVAAVSDGAGLAGADSFDLVFTTANWNVAQNVKVWGVSSISVGDLETVIDLTGSGSDADYAAVTGALGVVVTNTTVADLILDPAGTLTLNEGESGSFTVALTAQPTADVTVTVTSDNSYVASID